ncbi:hypothetical protein [Aliikangiella coralliicola]|uniref:Uncharacterized protein n=1 Tax=Aliikangiella coralliicola TaxID=2592383 RepID=A0A545U059_9GAMM|nr:hypothetical protein [Aliikangiella coralliicola]TQV82849.1 hypothetical protein FLL46_24070 [Aliikangiella coralliicola]
MIIKKYIFDVALLLTLIIAGFIYGYTESYKPTISSSFAGSLVFVFFASPYFIIRAIFIRSIKKITLGGIKTESGNKTIAYLVSLFRIRAKRLTFAARIILVFIFVTLLGGAQIYIYADSIARKTTQMSRNYETTQFIQKISESVITSMMNKSEIVIDDTAFIQKLEETKYGRVPLPLKIERALTDKLNKDLNNILAPQLNSHLAKVQIEQQAKGWSSSEISALSTRVGAVFMLLFLVQILVSLYKYSTRLAAFYDGRADALQLSKRIDNLTFEELVKLTSPDDLDYSKAHKAPSDQAVELAKQLLKSGK